jgi:DNA-binding response OmpR family regulator
VRLPKKLLIIEPDSALAELYTQFFESEGYVVRATAHPQDAILLVDAEVPDLVLLELQLIGHSGVEFLYEFRSYSEWGAVPVILLTMVTPHALGITAAMMRAFGIARCLYKPATKLRYLQSTVDEVLAVHA